MFQMLIVTGFFAKTSHCSEKALHLAFSFLFTFCQLAFLSPSDYVSEKLIAFNHLIIYIHM